MRNYNFGYEMPISGNGSRLGISYSQMDYTLGDYFNLLDAVGKAKTFSIYGSTPLANTSSSKLDLVYGYDNRQLQDEMRLFGYNAKKAAMPYIQESAATVEAAAAIQATARFTIGASLPTKILTAKQKAVSIS